MYDSSGHYEAFARPRKPVGVENKSAWFGGSGLAALAALAGAAFLVCDGPMPGQRTTILEQQRLPAGALGGIREPEKGFVTRGEDAHTDGPFTLGERAQKEIVKRFLAPREAMENKRINEMFGEASRSPRTRSWSGSTGCSSRSLVTM